MPPTQNSFHMAQAQFDAAAEHLGLEPVLRELLRWPAREFRFTLPTKMDDGSTRVFHGYRVQYNDARGPCKGGLRWHPEETMDTVRALGAWMTWKTAVADLPLGGGKGGITCNPKELSLREQEQLARGWMRVMARSLGPRQDVPAPDVYTNPTIMAWMMDEYEVVTGKRQPAVITGKPLPVGGSQGRHDATARGGVYAVREACRLRGIDPTGRYIIQGFGNAGQHTARLHREILGGGVLLAVSDTSGAVTHPEGLDVDALIEHKQRTGKVSGFPGGAPLDPEHLFTQDADILYPAALENALNRHNAPGVRASLVCELANGPTTPEADRILYDKGVHVIPDFLANSGGVTVSYFEQVQGLAQDYWSLEEIHRRLEERMTRAYDEVAAMQKEQGCTMRMAAYLLAVARVADAVRLRGWV